MSAVGPSYEVSDWLVLLACCASEVEEIKEIVKGDRSHRSRAAVQFIRHCTPVNLKARARHFVTRPNERSPTRALG